MRRSALSRVGLAAVLLIPAALVACTAPSPNGSPPGTPPTGSDGVTVVEGAAGDDDAPVATDAAALVLYVSNQSFDHDVVRIEVSVDDVLVVDADFAVEGQHNWVRFPLELPPGEHEITATSGTDVSMTGSVVVPAGERRWAVLNYWYYPDRGDGSDVVDPSFTFETFEESVAFD